MEKLFYTVSLDALSILELLLISLFYSSKDYQVIYHYQPPSKFILDLQLK